MNEKSTEKKQKGKIKENSYSNESNNQSNIYLNDKKENICIYISPSNKIQYNYSNNNYINNNENEYRKKDNINAEKKDNKAQNNYKNYFNTFEERKSFIDNIINSNHNCSNEPKGKYNLGLSCYKNSIVQEKDKSMIEENDCKDYVKKNEQNESTEKYASIIEKLKSQIHEKTEELKKNNTIIEKLKTEINEKNKELILLKNELDKKSDNNSLDKSLFRRDQMLALNFTSMDQKIHYAIPCVGEDIFVDIEKKLYNIFPEYKETNNVFLSQENTILRFKTISENNLESGYPIIMYKSGEKEN
jgi:hypothetical protein